MTEYFYMSTRISRKAVTLTNSAALFDAAKTGDFAAVKSVMAQKPRIVGPGTRDANRTRP